MMMKYHPILIVLLFQLTINIKIQTQNSECRFAKDYKTQDLFSHPQLLNQFLDKFISWQTNFIRKIGVDDNTGLTFDGIRVDVDSGQILPQTLHRFTASSKQSVHLSIMAKVLQHSQFANNIYTPTEVFRLIEKKVETLDIFYRKYPGFAGFMPWVMVEKDGIVPTHDFQSRVPSLDNGQMFWGALALSKVWQTNYPSILPQLRARFDDLFWKGMIRNCRKVFFNETTGKIRGIANIANISLDVSLNNYTNSDEYYLDDPYEGQLFTWILTLFAKDQFSSQQIDKIWQDKRHKLQSTDYRVKSRGNVSITVEKGWWFSSHEQWKLLFLPYRLSQTYSRVMINNQRARSWHSVDLNLPGMYGCQAGSASNNIEDTGYYCSGIEEISFQKVIFDKLVTPYGCFPLLLVNKQLGSAWLHNTIYSPGGQTLYGALEGTGLNGSLISPVLTWDTKITAALAVMNGTWSISQKILEKQGLLTEFITRVQKQYLLAFPIIKGEQLPIPLPSRQVKQGRPDFSTCN